MLPFHPETTKGLGHFWTNPLILLVAKEGAGQGSPMIERWC